MTALDTKALLPCPFCGGEVHAVVELEHAYWIEHVERGSCLVFDAGMWATDFEWNVRAAPRLARRVIELEEALAEARRFVALSCADADPEVQEEARNTLPIIDAALTIQGEGI